MEWSATWMFSLSRKQSAPLTSYKIQMSSPGAVAARVVLPPPDGPHIQATIGGCGSAAGGANSKLPSVILGASSLSVTNVYPPSLQVSVYVPDHQQYRTVT